MNTDIITPDEIKALLNRAPAKLELIDAHAYIDEHNLALITSPNIFSPNSNKFHPQGLFSEEIFGSITSMDRFTTEAAIALNTRIIHPMIFASNIKSKSLYVNILAGKQYALFDDIKNDFVLADKDDQGAQTGFQFFISNISKLANSVNETNSLRAANRQKLYSKYKDRLTATHLICLPAGLRDLDLKSARLSNDDINKIYMSIINITMSLSGYHLSEDPIFDGIRYQLQMKVSEVYEYLLNVISGKGGFLQKHYGARKIAFSTRNVISAPTNDADTTDDPSMIKADETMVPMLNLIKCFQPFFVNYVKRKLYGEIFVHGSTEKVAVIDPKTLGIQYTMLKPNEINKYTTSEGVTKIINQFKHVGFRESPISITDNTGKMFYLLLVYNAYDKVFVGKSLEDLERLVSEHGINFDKKSVQPMRWVEFLYIAGVNISKDKHAFVTRYPVLGDGSIYPCKIHVITTNPSKKVSVIFSHMVKFQLPHYPVIGNPYFESLIIHQSRLPGLSADFDGDVCSLSAVWSKEGNEDIRQNIKQISSVIGPDMKLKLSTDSDILNLTIHNLSRQDV